MTPDSPVLSIGAVLGDADPESMTWKRAINALSRQVQSLRADVSSPIRLNVVYHVDGRLVPNEFTGARAGRFDERTSHLLVQVAVPSHPAEDRSALLIELLERALDVAEAFARERGIATDLAELRELAARFG